MDTSKKIGSYFEKNYQAGRKIIWKVLLKEYANFLNDDKKACIRKILGT